MRYTHPRSTVLSPRKILTQVPENMDKGFNGDPVISMASTRVPPGVRTSQPEGHTLEIAHNGQKRDICAFCTMDKSQTWYRVKKNKVSSTGGKGTGMGRICQTGILIERNRDTRAKEEESPDKSWGGKERQVPDR